MKNKIAIVTGGNSGIGKYTATALKKAGCTVYELSRREILTDGINHITADVTNEASIADAVSHIINREGRIDILINCAGYGISGAVEFTELSDAKSQFNVNFFGMVNMNKAVLPHMRSNKSGRIVNISSQLPLLHISPSRPIIPHQRQLLNLIPVLLQMRFLPSE